MKMQSVIPSPPGYGTYATLALLLALLPLTSLAQQNPFSASLDHAGIIEDWDEEAFERGKKFYESSCISCHGVLGQSPEHPRARAFGSEPFNYGDDPYSMYQTLTHGAGAMLAQTWLSPAERYDVIHYLREAVLRPSEKVEVTELTSKYLKSLPKGTLKGRRTATSPRDYGPVLASQIERRVNLALTFALGGGISMSYDLQRMVISDVWSGGLDLSLTHHVRLRGERQPIPKGEVLPDLNTWYWPMDADLNRPPALRNETWIDGSESSTWLPPEVMAFHGHYVYGRSAVLSFAIRGRDVLEMPGAMNVEGLNVLHHTLRVAPGDKELLLCVGQYTREGWPIDNVLPLFGATQSESSATGTYVIAGGESQSGDYGDFITAAATGETDGLRWSLSEDQKIILHIPPSEEARRFRIYRASGSGAGHVEVFARSMAQAHDQGQLGVPDLSDAMNGGPRLWRDEFTTAIAMDDAAYHYSPLDYEEDDRRTVEHRHFPYTVDTIALPEPNPWNAWMRMSDLAFFDDGRLAVSTLGGDIWFVDGLAEGATQAKWKRFASGLFEPLGLNIFDGVVYAMCRGGIIRLHDLNNDDQADYYESFHADHDISNGFHGYNFDLLQDDEKNFYYIKPGLFTDYHTAGSVVKVSPDGKDYEIVATGFRVPNGMGQRPDGSIYATDNQGRWTPANKINRIERGNFYGVFQSTKVEREGYDLPVMWLPQEIENSAGNMTFASDERFGPLAGKMIMPSFGKGWVSYFMEENVEGAWQGTLAAFPFQFLSGMMRSAQSPADGQFYVTGLTGWDTESTQQEGALQRIRYIGGEGAILVDARTEYYGVSLTFSSPLDGDTASNIDNYAIERWNYNRTNRYGSPHFSIEEPDKEGHDQVRVMGVLLTNDRRTVSLKLSSMVPAETMRVHYVVKSAAGTPVEDAIYMTIHKVPSND